MPGFLSLWFLSYRPDRSLIRQQIFATHVVCWLHFVHIKFFSTFKLQHRADGILFPHLRQAPNVSVNKFGDTGDRSQTRKNQSFTHHFAFFCTQTVLYFFFNRFLLSVN
jgi:hypothetical protein